MSNDSIILELLRRVHALEEKVLLLEESRIQAGVLNEELDEEDEENKITRTVAREYIMDTIKKKYLYLDVKKGNRASRADIVMTMNGGPKKGMQILSKFFYSKSHLDFPSGWHTLKKSDLDNDNIDMYIFTVSFNNNYYSVVFSKEELRLFVQSKALSSANVYYFYFHLTDEKRVEIRDVEKDVSHYFGHWDLIAQIADAKSR